MYSNPGKNILLSLGAILSLLLLSHCQQSPAAFPRPWGFHRIPFPDSTTHTRYASPYCGFSFEYPDFGEILLETKDSCWVDFYFPRYQCKWHVTYYETAPGGKDRNTYFEDHRAMIYKHSKKATMIQPNFFEVAQGYGTFYEVSGNVGTPAQFFISDTTDRHILMTSFYFDTALKNDSLQPIIQYMKGELQHMISSLRWQ